MIWSPVTLQLYLGNVPSLPLHTHKAPSCLNPRGVSVLAHAISSARTFLLTFVYLANACSSLKKCYLLCEAVSITVFSVLHLRRHCLWFSVRAHPVLLYLFLCSGSHPCFSVILSLSAFSLPCPSCQHVNMSDLCHLKNKPQTVTESFHFSIPSPSPSWYYFSKE